jgi:hypothetical protein
MLPGDPGRFLVQCRNGLISGKIRRYSPNAGGQHGDNARHDKPAPYEPAHFTTFLHQCIILHKCGNSYADFCKKTCDSESLIPESIALSCGCPFHRLLLASLCGKVHEKWSSACRPSGGHGRNSA